MGIVSIQWGFKLSHAKTPVFTCAAVQVALQSTVLLSPPHLVHFVLQSLGLGPVFMLSPLGCCFWGRVLPGLVQRLLSLQEFVVVRLDGGHHGPEQRVVV